MDIIENEGLELQPNSLIEDTQISPPLETTPAIPEQIVTEEQQVQETPTQPTELGATEETPTQEVPIGKVLPDKNVREYTTEIDEALSSGIGIRRLAELFVKGTGMSVEDTENTMVEMLQTKVSDLKDEGIPREDIIRTLQNRAYSEETIAKVLEKYTKPSVMDRLRKYEYNPRNTKTEDIQLIADLVKNIHGTYSSGAKGALSTLGGISGKIFASSFGEEAGIKARQEVNQLNVTIAKELVDNGYEAYINPENGEVMYKDENGKEQELSSNVLNEFINGKFELISAIGGGIVGANILNKYTSIGGTAIGGVIGGRIAGGAGMRKGAQIGYHAGKWVGTALGAGLGAAGGRALDMILNATLLKENIEQGLYLTQMKEAAIFDVTTGILGTTAVRTSKGLGKSVMRAYNFVAGGNSRGAYKFLLDTLSMNKEQASKLIARYEEVTGVKRTFGEDVLRYNIGVIARTQKGVEGAVLQAISKDSKAANTLVKEIDKTTKELRRAITSVKGENVGKLIREDLATYVKDVDQFFGATEDVLVDAARGKGFTYNKEALGSDKLLNFITSKKTVKDVDAAANMIDIDLLKVEAKVTDALRDTSIKGLLELRKTINAFMYGGRKFTRPDKVILQGVKQRVDTQIHKAAREYIPNSREWINQFSKANDAFSTMKKLEENVFYKSLTKERGLVSEASIEADFTSYIDSLNEEFLDVVKHLPKSTKAKAEGAIINRHFTNNTHGKALAFEVTDFPELSHKLQEVNFTTPRAKNLKLYIDALGETFQNNVNLAGATGKIEMPTSNIPINENLGSKMKMSLINTVWTELKALAPTKLNAGRSLIKQLEKILENPSHANTVSKFLSKLPAENREVTKRLLTELQVAMAKEPKKAPSDFQPVYKQSKTGKVVITEGVLGKGAYFFDRVKNPKVGANIIKQEVNMSRMATLDDISSLVGRPVSVEEVRKIPNLTQQLMDRGYNGITTKGRFMLFKTKSLSKTIGTP